MFYRMITHARDRWLASPDCTVKDLLGYMERAGQLRDAQLDAIKTYLYLKISCGCRPLAELFAAGVFNTEDIGELPLADSVKQYLRADPAAAALLEYSRQKNTAEEQVSPRLEQLLSRTPEQVDCAAFFRKAFYNVSYTDYLFSLPMGAGKTWLMAAFIYLDLYFARNEPQNPVFAHNFIIFAPSGLKSSVVPSLRSIQKFDPAWVLPEPAASAIKRLLSFEVLDQAKTASKSNKTKNPTVQKIANHQPLAELFGLVAVTNAEKVILDRIQEKSGQISFYDESEDAKDRQANELRNLIGKLPALSVFIDEVHHAVSDEIKLRAVVNRWAGSGTVNSVIGFSGTPYLEKPEKVAAAEGLSVASAEITNIVYYYPLVNGVGNFLKRPVVKITDIPQSARIIENGVRAFLDTYKDTVYRDGTCAKLGIYCGSIAKLEQVVSPLVTRLAAEYGLPGDAVLRFHKGNAQYPQPADSQLQFDSLDAPFSRVRIVLLVQIGKEGWDCRSLTGIILSQEGDCPQNMVLQTTCRCLRQVDKGVPETALVYLNSTNAEKLNAQLQQQHRITLKEFGAGAAQGETLARYDRTAHLKLPKVDLYQLRVRYSTAVTQKADPVALLPQACAGAEVAADTVITTDLTLRPQQRELDDAERGDVPAALDAWLYGIARSSFGMLPLTQLREYRAALQAVFDRITYVRDGARYFSSRYDRAAVEANIRRAFCARRSFATLEELVPEEASLLNTANFRPVIHTETPQRYYPDQQTVENILLDDSGKLQIDPELENAIRVLEQTGNAEMAAALRRQNSAHPQKDRSFHYLPYRTDSDFEQRFLDDVLPLLDGAELRPLGLELYYNGDDALTEFRIRCYRSVDGHYRYIGMYTPDFLLLQRRNGRIHKAIIIETKGSLYANDPKFKDKRAFAEGEFLRQNNAAFGYKKFAYLYLEDTLPQKERLMAVREKIQEFFEA